MDKEDVAHIYNGILLSHKGNDIELFVVRWMDLQSVIESEVRKRKTNTICYHIYMESKSFLKNGSDEPKCRTGIKTQT